MLIKRIILPALLVFLSNCTPPVVMLVNPRNGDTRRCSTAEVGVASHDSATYNRVMACIHQWKALGYVENELLTPEQRARLAFQP
jgi:hypothetical protein